MKVTFLKKERDNTRLILVYAGWSTRPDFYAGLVREGWDLCVVHEYSDMRIDLSFLDEYYTVYLFAWSLGVYCAERSLPADRITAAFALNGTPLPVDNLYGIPESIYEGTLQGLDERNLMKFRRRMMPDATTFKTLFGNATDDDVEGLKYELAAIARDALQNSEEKAGTDSVSEARRMRRQAVLPWTRAYVSDNDRIFPPDNMRRYWQEETETMLVPLAGAHYYPLKDIVAMAIPDTETVSRRFAGASISYDTNAIAQHSAAVYLGMLLDEAGPRREGAWILEIGCGTGLFTKEWSRYLKPGSATFIDIAPCGPFGVASEEEYIRGDAEKWLEETDRTFDCILSASAIQWFADIPRFIANAASHLNPGGIFAVSTFLPGNMKELDELRPSPLNYPRLEMLREEMSRNFGESKTESRDIKVSFRSVREMLMHLKHTGVGGSAPGTGLSLADMAHLRSLTYRVVWLIGMK